MNNREYAETVRLYLAATAERREESTEATHDDCILCYETGWFGGCGAFGRCTGPQTSPIIESTGDKPTERPALPGAMKGSAMSINDEYILLEAYKQTGRSGARPIDDFVKRLKREDSREIVEALMAYYEKDHPRL